MRVVPTEIAPKINARCDIDLSPGTATRPDSARAFAAINGVAVLASMPCNIHIAGRRRETIADDAAAATRFCF